MSSAAVTPAHVRFRPWREAVATAGALAELGAVLEPLLPVARALHRITATVSPPAWDTGSRREPRDAGVPVKTPGHRGRSPAGADACPPLTGATTAAARVGLAAGFLRALRRPMNVAFIAVLTVVMTSWWVAFRPVSVFGGSASFLVVRGTSMLPTLKTGDFVLAEAQPSYKVGDLVVYAVPKGLIGAGDDLIHRIVAGNATTGYTLKGDNNPAPDPWTVPRSDILGKESIVIPGAGRWLLVIRSPLFAGLIAAAIAVWMVLSPPEWLRRREKPGSPEPDPIGAAAPPFPAPELEQSPIPTPARRRTATAARATVLGQRPATRTRSRTPAQGAARPTRQVKP